MAKNRLKFIIRIAYPAPRAPSMEEISRGYATLLHGLAVSVRPRTSFPRSSVERLPCTRGFGWYSPGAVAWRQRVGEIGAVFGVEDTAGIKRKLGPKWAYRLRESITTASEEDWHLLLHCLGPATGSPST